MLQNNQTMQAFTKKSFNEGQKIFKRRREKFKKGRAEAIAQKLLDS